MTLSFRPLLPALLFLLAFAVSLTAQTPTEVVVRAQAKDAKFIGSSIGGAHVIIRNSLTGEILARGLTEGGTGNTDRIMRTPRERYAELAGDGAAAFRTTLSLTEPVLVTVEVVAPVRARQAAVRGSIELWLLPGKPIDGDGIIVEIPGFVVDVLSPRTHQSLSAGDLPDGKLTIEANVVMMCGCPVSSGGLWDADQMEIGAYIRQGSGEASELRLQPTERANLFRAEWTPPGAGAWEITVYAYDPRTGNTGLDRVNFLVE